MGDSVCGFEIDLTPAEKEAFNASVQHVRDLVQATEPFLKS